ncbi:hypothetical protein ACQP1G_21310 [Nocardia sp. CA-107356]|uniref:hypothetical protein n=1 Tax=Nocardia sp. CA-107356 TaxID=3239972 RepID=UPI003D8B1A28
MTVDTSAGRINRALAALVDDAGLFPPANLPMAEALSRHRHDTQYASPVLTHRFLCPVERISELLEDLHRDDTIRIVLLGPTTGSSSDKVDDVIADPRVEVAALEAPLATLTVCHPALDRLPRYAEIHPDNLAALPAIAAAGLRAKIRCGGLQAEAFPSARQLGRFIAECARVGVGFKATAGLHHALPYRDRVTQFQHHGFLNILLAVARAADGAPESQIVHVLQLADSTSVADEVRALGAELAAAARRLFTAYGSCDTQQPLDDLYSLGLISRNGDPR